MKLAVVLFNLGGPDSPEAVEPFLRNLFSDPAILKLPYLARMPLARLIARRRAALAREIYAKIGGRSPILEETQAQARALQSALSMHDTRVFIAMRCWKPFAAVAAHAIKAWGADRVVLLPLYPQFSTTTTGSSFADWRRVAAAAGLNVPTARVCCYPDNPGFIKALAALIRQTMARMQGEISYRVLLSAHGLPERISMVDPYRSQIERTASAVVEGLGIKGLDWTVCYQSRVGPLKWIGPSTDAEVRRAGADGKGVVVVPIAFVSEHSETLVELDIDYAKLAAEVGVRDYLRVPTVGVEKAFIEGLAELVLEVGGRQRFCPAGQLGCGFEQRA